MGLDGSLCGAIIRASLRDFGKISGKFRENFVKISGKFRENFGKISGKFLGEKVIFDILASSAFRKYSTCWVFFILFLSLSLSLSLSSSLLLSSSLSFSAKVLSEKIILISLHCRNF